MRFRLVFDFLLALQIYICPTGLITSSGTETCGGKVATKTTAAMETSAEPDAMCEEEVVEVVKTAPMKEANSNNNEGITEPVVIRIAISGVILI